MPTSVKPVRLPGKPGSVVSNGQPDKFRVKVPPGNPAILIRPGPTIVI